MFLTKSAIKNKISKKKAFKVKKKINGLFYFNGTKFNYSYNLKLIDVLKQVYGLGYKRFLTYFATQLGYSLNYPVIYISVMVFYKLQLKINNLFVNYDLRKYVKENIEIQRLMRMYTGYRHVHRLPVRGQRSKTNAGTQKQKKILGISDSKVAKSRRSKKKK